VTPPGGLVRSLDRGLPSLELRHRPAAFLMQAGSGANGWWVAVTAGAGVMVGVLRSLTKLPARIPGLIADIEGAHVEPRLVPGIVVVSAVSLIGGASLGPEQALGSMGGGAGTWMARRRSWRQSVREAR
jgi:H+/Cl- antiporter ClcA